MSVNAEIPAQDIFEHARSKTATLGLEARTANSARENDLHRSVPATGLRVFEWVPLPHSRIALYKSQDETDNGQNIQNDAKRHYRNFEPPLWPEKANEQNTDAQFWQYDTEKCPGISEDDPECGRWDGVEVNWRERFV